MNVNTNSKASVEFDIARPLLLTRSETRSTHLSDTPIVYIYSRALDGVNAITVAKVEIANIVGLHTEQVQALTDHIADEIINPAFSDDDIDDIAFAIMDCEGTHSSVCEHHTARAREVAESIMTRRRYAAKEA